MRPESFAARLALVIPAYFLTGWLGLRFATYAGSVTLIWAPTGIALAAFSFVSTLAIARFISEGRFF